MTNMITAPKVITRGEFICRGVNDLMARASATAKWNEVHEAGAEGAGRKLRSNEALQ